MRGLKVAGTIFLGLFFASCFLSQTAFAGRLPLSVVNEVKRGVERDDYHDYLFRLFERACDVHFRIAADEMAKIGRKAEALALLTSWENKQPHFQEELRASAKSIGDHAPINQWVAEKYDIIEFILGRDLCLKLHIAIIKTFNFGIPVAIKPCSFPMDQVQGERIDEYRRHMVGGPFGDDVYWGVLPEAAWLVSYIACSIGTSGTGFVLACGLAAGLSERLMGFMGGRISDAIYQRNCQ